ncbi:MAG: restriction endonuclease subunit S [Sulfurimicrobium sp.]|nr:restriction endonuclease subunit S [Sulfurimicrobium sp.]
MTKSDATRKVPELRFPEFLDAGEWEEKQLDEVANFAKAKIPLSELTVQNYVSTENILPDFAGITHANRLPPTGAATAFLVGDILISNIRPYLKKIWHSEFDGGASNDVLIVRAKKSINDKYLSFVLINDFFINYVMTGAKGVKMPRGDISLIEQFGVPLPASSKEQQKIADCLSSIDELVAAQTQKLATLKTHKKGLMQQLFPAEGETLPKLRFPEFRDAGEWEEKRLGDICVYVSSGKDGNDAEGCYELYGSTGIIGKSPNASYEGEFILVARVGANAGQMARAKGKFGVTDNTLVISLSSPANLCFIFMALENFNPRKLVFGSGQPLITGGQLKEVILRLPETSEQQKIANCLSSIDELIAAQAQKLTTLKAHKKGLMQQLFPSCGGGPRRGGVVRGSLKPYASPELRATEQDAWQAAVKEKHEPR